MAFVLVRSVVNLYGGVKSRGRVDSDLSEECCDHSGDV